MALGILCNTYRALAGFAPASPKNSVGASFHSAYAQRKR
jgi:hypothetical protein